MKKNILFIIFFLLIISLISSGNFGIGSEVNIKNRDSINELRNKDTYRVSNYKLGNNLAYKSYNVSEKKIIIEDRNFKKLIELKLLSDYSIKVNEGEDIKIAEFLLIDWQGSKLFDLIEVYDIENDYKKEEKQFTLKYEINNNWIEFNSLEDLPYKNIKIGLFTNTNLGERKEWIPTIRGFKIYEWADWDVTGGTPFEFNTEDSSYHSLVQINATHALSVYAKGISSDGWAVVLEVDGDTVSKPGSEFEFDTDNGRYHSIVKINSTHYLNVYAGEDNNASAVVLEVDGNTVSKPGSILIFGVDFLSKYHSLVKMNDTHYIVAYTASTNYTGRVVVLEVDGNTVSKPGSILEFTPDEAYSEIYCTSLAKINNTHYLSTYENYTQSGHAVVFKVDGNTITQGADFLFSSANNSDDSNSLVQINSTHYINAYRGIDQDGFAVVLKVDGDTITKGTPFEFDLNASRYNSLIKINNTHYINSYQGYNGDGFAVVLEVNGDTISKPGSEFEFDVNTSRYNSLVKMNTTHYLNTYEGIDQDGFAVVLIVELTLDPPSNTAPTLIANATYPEIVYTNTDYLINLTATDAEESNIFSYVQFYINSTKSGGEINYSMVNNTNTLVATLGNGNFSKSDILLAEVWIGDGTENTTKVNLTNITVQNSIPTTPTDLTINSTIKVAEVLKGTCSDSTDADSDSITYHYEFYNNNDTSTIQAYSSTQTYTIQDSDAHKVIRVRCKATTSDANSTEDEETISVSNSIPESQNLSISSDDSSNTTISNLTGIFNYYDLDSDAQTNNETKWYNNTIEVESLRNLTNIGAGNISRFQNWTFTSRVYDGSNWGIWVNSSKFEVLNTIPEAQNLSITNDNDLNCSDGNLTGDFNYYDLDSDAQTNNETKWYNNTIEVESLRNLTYVGYGNLTLGENWTFTSRVYDGSNWSTWVNSSISYIEICINTTPTITIIKPTGLYGDTRPLSIPLNISINDSLSVENCTYDIPGETGQNNISMGLNGNVTSLFYANATGTISGAGTKIIYFYCNNTEGNIGSASIQVTDDGGGSAVPDSTPSICNPEWECGSWSFCITGTQKRICIDINNCEEIETKPIEIRDCKIWESIKEKVGEEYENTIEKLTTYSKENEGETNKYLIYYVGLMFLIFIILVLWQWKRKK